MKFFFFFWKRKLTVFFPFLFPFFFLLFFLSFFFSFFASFAEHLLQA